MNMWANGIKTGGMDRADVSSITEISTWVNGSRESSKGRGLTSTEKGTGTKENGKTMSETDKVFYGVQMERST